MNQPLDNPAMARSLQISRALLIGSLYMIREWIFKNHPDGIVYGHQKGGHFINARVIEDACLWDREKKENRLIKACIEFGYLEQLKKDGKTYGFKWING